MKLCSTLFFAAFVLTISTSLGQTTDNKTKLIGKWVGNDEGYDMYLDFKSDGSAVVDHDDVRYVVKATTIELTADGETLSYNYTLRDNELKVWGGDLAATMNFKRVPPGQEKNINSSRPSGQTQKH